MMLGLLLARAGVDVAVLEKHADFFRDFRGDTIHPSTLHIMDELGLLERFLAVPHSQVTRLTARIGDTTLAIASFEHVPGPCKFLAFMPQWDFLKFLAGEAARYPAFRLEMQAEATQLVRRENRVAGVSAQTPHGVRTIEADLVVACDGRHSVLRELAGLPVIDVGAPIDVLWMRLSRKPGDPGQAFGNIAAGGILVALDRGDYYQCAFVIRKGAFDAVRARGIAAFRTDVAAIAPFLSDRVQEIVDWDQVKLLTVRVDRLRRWYVPGLLCIGDAAHAMSPIGGVGINLAIQDAVASANILARPLLQGSATTGHLRAVQHRRQLPTRLTQALQVQIQNRILNPVFSASNAVRVPAVLRFVDRLKPLQRIPAFVVGVGFRPEHVRSPQIPPTTPRT